MPSRNTLKLDVPETYYHVYARGASKQTIFLDTADYHYFEKLFARYLSLKPATSKEGVLYPHFRGQIELTAFCLMGNHFHLLIYQQDAGSMAEFMRCLMTSYSRYFNLKYERTGSLFESRYKASRIMAQDYLEHITRYIHLNPRYWRRYPYSSLAFYLQEESPEWLQPGKIMAMFASPEEYLRFVSDYEDHKTMLDEIKNHLANH